MKTNTDAGSANGNANANGVITDEKSDKFVKNKKNAKSVSIDFPVVELKQVPEPVPPSKPIDERFLTSSMGAYSAINSNNYHKPTFARKRQGHEFSKRLNNQEQIFDMNQNMVENEVKNKKDNDNDKGIHMNMNVDRLDKEFNQLNMNKKSNNSNPPDQSPIKKRPNINTNSNGNSNSKNNSNSGDIGNNSSSSKSNSNSNSMKRFNIITGTYD